MSIEERFALGLAAIVVGDFGVVGSAREWRLFVRWTAWKAAECLAGRDRARRLFVGLYTVVTLFGAALLISGLLRWLPV